MKFEGVYAALVTPFNSKLEVDEKALRHEVDFLVRSNVHGLVVLGSVGEFPYITVEEKKKVIDIAVKQAAGRLPVIVCPSAMGTDEVILLSKHAGEFGASGFMITLPLYYPLSDDDICGHYQAISYAVDLPIILY
ncbi:MAG: dihydrodipicolinate synthase family protein, partial [Dehalococcoidia bacterium]|nr:dihydrodipicolinate synthase family protein [Dehalococcoidia bacterium]